MSVILDEVFGIGGKEFCMVIIPHTYATVLCSEILGALTNSNSIIVVNHLAAALLVLSKHR